MSIELLQHLAAKFEADLRKSGFVPMPGGQPAQDPAAAGMPTMDPSMAAGMPAMDPSMAAGMPPMDPSMMGGAAPVDPSMAAGMPPMDPSMAGGAPQAGAVPPDQLTQLIKTIVEETAGQKKKTGNKAVLDRQTAMLEAIMNHLGIPVPPEDQGDPAADQDGKKQDEGANGGAAGFEPIPGIEEMTPAQIAQMSLGQGAANPLASTFASMGG